jgi:hypothetical protein
MTDNVSDGEERFPHVLGRRTAPVGQRSVYAPLGVLQPGASEFTEMKAR